MRIARGGDAVRSPTQKKPTPAVGAGVGLRSAVARNCSLQLLELADRDCSTLRFVVAGASLRSAAAPAGDPQLREPTSYSPAASRRFSRAS